MMVCTPLAENNILVMGSWVSCWFVPGMAVRNSGSQIGYQSIRQVAAHIGITQLAILVCTIMRRQVLRQECVSYHAGSPALLMIRRREAMRGFLAVFANFSVLLKPLYKLTQ